MNNIFSYWPLLFLFLIIGSRLINFINKNKNKNKSSDNTSSKEKPIAENNNLKEEDYKFAYDEQVNNKAQNNNISKDVEQKKNKKSKKKIRVKKISKKKKGKLFFEKEDLVKGIIMKEIIDEPRFKKNKKEK